MRRRTAGGQRGGSGRRARCPREAVDAQQGMHEALRQRDGLKAALAAAEAALRSTREQLEASADERGRLNAALEESKEAASASRDSVRTSRLEGERCAERGTERGAERCA